MPDLIFALNTNDIKTAENWASLLKDEVNRFKIGIPLLFKYGEECLERISRYGKLFVDLKLNDIPSVINLSLGFMERFETEFITVHATSGPNTIKATVDWASLRGIKVLGVTVLTSIDDISSYKIFRQNTVDAVLNLVELTLNSGANGIVCSGLEVEPVRMRFGNQTLIVTPGFRFTTEKKQDQSRVLTPENPALKSVDYLVIGRAVTNSKYPVKTLKIIKSLVL